MGGAIGGSHPIVLLVSGVDDHFWSQSCDQVSCLLLVSDVENVPGWSHHVGRVSEERRRHQLMSRDGLTNHLGAKKPTTSDDEHAHKEPR